MKKIISSFIFFLFVNFLSHGQQTKLSKIEKEINSIEQNLNNYKFSEVDWNEFINQKTNGKGVVKIWKHKKQARKIVEEIDVSKGKITRIIYLKNGNPIKGTETEHIFDTEQNKLIEIFKLEVYVIAYNPTIDEYDFETKKTGKRTFTEIYSDLNSLFHSIEKLKSE